jgi:hypothetical protein
MSTTWEQLEGAALSLARSGSIKERLTDAYRNHLALLSADDLPEVVREEFCGIHDALTRERPLRGEDAVRATVRKMSNREATEIACSVVRMFAALAREAVRESSAALTEQLLNGSAAGGARLKPLKSVPQVVALYAAEA